MGPDGLLLYDTQCPASPALPPGAPNTVLVLGSFLHLKTLPDLSEIDALPRGWPLFSWSHVELWASVSLTDRYRVRASCVLPPVPLVLRMPVRVCVSHDAVFPNAEISI